MSSIPSLSGEVFKIIDNINIAKSADISKLVKSKYYKEMSASPLADNVYSEIKVALNELGKYDELPALVTMIDDSPDNIFLMTRMLSTTVNTAVLRLQPKDESEDNDTVVVREGNIIDVHFSKGSLWDSFFSITGALKKHASEHGLVNGFILDADLKKFILADKFDDHNHPISDLVEFNGPNLAMIAGESFQNASLPTCIQLATGVIGTRETHIRFFAEDLVFGPDITISTGAKQVGVNFNKLRYELFHVLEKYRKPRSL